MSLLAPLGIVALSTAAGVLIGVTAAWRGGWVDHLASRLLETIFSFPSLLLAILFIAILGQGVVAPVAAMSIAYTPHVARLARSRFLQEMSKTYVSALRVLGTSGPAICFRHLVPAIAPVVLAQASVHFGLALMDLGALSFLGFGFEGNSIDWGGMVHDGQNALLQGHLLPTLVPGAFIVVAVVAFSLLGEGLAEQVRRREV